MSGHMQAAVRSSPPVLDMGLCPGPLWLPTPVCWCFLSSYGRTAGSVGTGAQPVSKVSFVQYLACLPGCRYYG